MKNKIKNSKIYPDSGVELNSFIAKNYDRVMNIASLGNYRKFITKAIQDINIEKQDNILDLGCGTGRNAKLMSKFLNDEGEITGIDLSEKMEKQFLKKFQNNDRISFLKKRIDQDFVLLKSYDKVFISFVIHGFPHEIRAKVIQNAYNNLKIGGSFYILDFAEFNMEEMPKLHRFVFEKIECKYAFDFIKKDWKKILKENGFGNFSEKFYIKNYVRLLKAEKL